MPECAIRRRRPLSRPGSPRRPGSPVFLLAVCWMALLAGCRLPGGGDPAGIAPFPGSGRSLAEVGRRALDALEAGDRAALAALRLSRDEYMDVVWPELPASAPDLNVPIEYVWADIEARDRSALARLAPQFGGLAAKLVDVACTGGVEEFETFRVHTGCRVVLRTPSGSHHRIQLFKDVVERGAGFKLFRYYDSMLRPVGTDPAGGG